MAIRTVKIYGLAYGSSPSSITVTANGTQIFSGTVTTVDQPIPPLPNSDLTQVTLFTFERDTAFTGQIPMNCTVNSGTVIFGKVMANYVSVSNPLYTPEQINTLDNPDTSWADKVAIYTQVANPPLSQQDIDVLLGPTTPGGTEKHNILVAHSCTTLISSGANGYGPIDNTDARSSVTIDGIAQTPDHGELIGTWWWTINTGSSLAYQLDVDPATV